MIMALVVVTMLMMMMMMMMMMMVTMMMTMTMTMMMMMIMVWVTMTKTLRAIMMLMMIMMVRRMIRIMMRRRMRTMTMTMTMTMMMMMMMTTTTTTTMIMLVMIWCGSDGNHDIDPAIDDHGDDGHLSFASDIIRVAWIVLVNLLTSFIVAIVIPVDLLWLWGFVEVRIFLRHPLALMLGGGEASLSLVLVAHHSGSRALERSLRHGKEPRASRKTH